MYKVSRGRRVCLSAGRTFRSPSPRFLACSSRGQQPLVDRIEIEGGGEGYVPRVPLVNETNRGSPGTATG